MTGVTRARDRDSASFQTSTIVFLTFSEVRSSVLAAAPLTFSSELEIAPYFDFILTSRDARSEKPDRKIFDQARSLVHVSDPSMAFHVGDSLDTDVAGAVAAGWNSLRFNEWFDEDFPDWTVADAASEAEQGIARHSAFMKWGRRDPARGLEWTDVWSLDDILYLFGFPEDMNKPVATTYIRGVHED